MTFGNEPARFAGLEVEGARCIEKSHQLSTVAPGAAAADDEWPLRGPDRVCRGPSAARVRRHCGARGHVEVLFEFDGLRHLGAKRVDREIQIDGPRLPAALAVRARDRFVHLGQHVRRIAHGPRIARERPDEGGMDDVLQRTAILLRLRWQSRENQDRCASGMRVCDAGHAVGDARTRGDQRDAEAAGEFEVRMRHVDRSALVAHIDDRNAFLREPHPDRHDVAAAEPENAIDAARFEVAGDQSGGATVADDWRHYVAFFLRERRSKTPGTVRGSVPAGKIRNL